MAVSGVLLLALSTFHATFAVPLAPRQAGCNVIGFTDTFQGGNWQTNWQEPADSALVGNIVADPSGSGINLALLTPGSGAVKLQSLQSFAPPATFSFVVQASDNSGTMSNCAIFDGSNTDSEIDLELMGWSEKAPDIMMPIWSDAHGPTPIPLSNAPPNWPADATGPSFTTSNGFTPKSNDRSVIQNPNFDARVKHNYTLQWNSDSIVWLVDTREVARYTRGSNVALWPTGPLPLNLGIWGGVDWLGPLDTSHTPTFKVFEVRASGCSA